VNREFPPGSEQLPKRRPFSRRGAYSTIYRRRDAAGWTCNGRFWYRLPSEEYLQIPQQTPQLSPGDGSGETQHSKEEAGEVSTFQRSDAPPLTSEPTTASTLLKRSAEDDLTDKPSASRQRILNDSTFPQLSGLAGSDRTLLYSDAAATIPEQSLSEFLLDLKVSETTGDYRIPEEFEGQNDESSILSEEDDDPEEALDYHLDLIEAELEDEEYR
jgi:hypothetical protein